MSYLKKEEPRCILWKKLKYQTTPRPCIPQGRYIPMGDEKFKTNPDKSSEFLY